MKSILFLFVVVILALGITAGILYSMGDGDNLGESKASVVVDDTPKVVFKWVSLPTYSTRWVHGLKKAKQVNKGDLKVGSIIRETIKVPNGAIAEITGKILKLEKNKLIVTEYYVSGMKLKRGKLVPVKRGDYATKRFISKIALEKIGENQTKVNYTINATYGRWYTRLLEPLVSSDTVEDMESSLKMLKVKVKKSAESRAKKKRDAEKKRDLEKSKLKKIPKGFDTSGLITRPKLKPMLKLYPKVDAK